MSRSLVQQLVGRAVTDRRFREELLRSPMQATRVYPFTREERELIASLRAETLEEFSRKLAEHLGGVREANSKR